MKKWTYLLVLVLVLALMPIYAGASSTQGATIQITAAPDAMAHEGFVTLNVTVTPGIVAMTDVKLFLEGGDTPIGSWSRIEVGSPVLTAIPDIYITAAQLGQNVPVALRYKVDGIEQVLRGNFIVWAGAPTLPTQAKITFQRTASAPSVAPGGSIAFTYVLRNDGLVDIRDIVVSDEMAGQVGALAALGPGQSQSWVINKTAQGDGLTSTPRVHYVNAVTGEGGNYDLEALVIPVANAKLSITLVADPLQVEAGQAVTLNCTVVNEGNVPYTDIQVSSEKTGMLERKERLDAGESILFSRKVQPVESGSYVFGVAAKDPAGASVALKSNEIQIQVKGSVPGEGNGGVTATGALEIKATPNIAALAEPGMVTFQITVRNTGSESLSQVELSEVGAGVIQRMDILPPGDKAFVYQENVEAGKGFQFVVKGKMADGTNLQNITQVIQITLRSEGASTVPEAEATPQIDMPSTSFEPAPLGNKEGGNPLVTALIVVSALIAACVLVLILMVVRGQKRNAQRAPYQRQDAPRGYARDDRGYARDDRGDAYDAQDDDYAQDDPYADEDEEVTRPLNQHRRAPKQDDVATRPLDPKRKRKG